MATTATQTAMAKPASSGRVAIWIQSVLLLMVAAVVILTLWFRIPPVPFFPFSAVDFVQLMTPLVMLALFFERAVEVFLTAGRGEGAGAIALEISRLGKLQKAGDQAIADQLVSKQQEEAAYKAKTQRIAFLATFLLGIIASALGVRAIGMFVDPAALNGLSAAHQRLFNTFDVVVTGGLLGGGADGMHKLVSVFTSWMDKAKATTEAASGGASQTLAGGAR